jgi:hypothetical protein
MLHGRSAPLPNNRGIEPPPLLLRHRRDRCFTLPTFVWHQAHLCVPGARAGRVRLEILLPWVRFAGRGLVLLQLVLMWQKRQQPLPTPLQAATAAANALRSGQFRGTRRQSVTGLVGGLVSHHVNAGAWRGELLLPAARRPLAREIPKSWIEPDLRDYLAWAFRLVSQGHWPHGRDRNHWVYQAHFKTAAFVAHELAKRWLRDPTSLEKPFGASAPRHLRAICPRLRKRIAEAWQSQKVTPIRLALALLDEVCSPLRSRRVLDPARLVGFDDGRLLSILLSREERAALESLRPAPTTYELLTSQNPDAQWFVRWWVNLLRAVPVYPGRPPEGPPAPSAAVPGGSPSPSAPGTQSSTQRDDRVYLRTVPGAEAWAERVWSAFYPL